MRTHLWLAVFPLAVILHASPVHADRLVSVLPFADLARAKNLQFPANVVNLQIADISAETRGRILSMSIKVGEKVKEGNLLVKLDCAKPRVDAQRASAGLKRLQAARKLTEQQLERAQRLLSARSISQQELDQRQTQLSADSASIEEQEALLESARIQVSNCRVSAPYSGTIVRKHAHPGTYVVPGTPLYTLLQEDAVEVHLEIPADQINRLRHTREIQFEAGAKRYPLSVRAILPLIDAQSLQQQVRLSFNSGDKPAGGAFGLVEFESPRHYLPSRYVQKREGRFGVFIAQGNRATFHPLVDVQEGQDVAVDFTVDRMIITSDLQHLQHQERIKINP